ncbi:MAG: hypothetical protein GEU86_00150 [Actinophytocola sp.]|nr:hypothetical protein [Actinophytocola sp.]
MAKLAKLSAIAAFAVVAALFGVALSASAGHVTPTVLSGNPSCEGGIKIEPVVSGTYDGVTITVHGSTFDFTTTGDTVVTSVIVKGGPNANLYTYNPAATSDTGLQAPANPKNDRPYGLSHLCFFTDEDDKGEPTDPKDPTTAPDPKNP